MMMKHGHIAGTAAALAALGLAGCATRHSPALERAQFEYDQAARDPQIVQNAPVKLHEARQALERAQDDWYDEHDGEEAEHDAYIVERRLDIARATAAEEAARKKLKQSSEELVDKLSARETDRGTVLTLGNDVLFPLDEATLKPGVRQNLDPLVSFLDEHPQRDVLIEGHTDSTGSNAYNLDLSRRRAQSVAGFLENNGISPGRITTRGYGEDLPIASNANSAGRQQNRRVNIVILRDGMSASDAAQRSSQLELR